MGCYFNAVAKTSGTDEAQGACRAWLKEFEPHLDEACVGQVSEIFDGDEPYESRGCVAQAWSVAELLRVAVEFGIEEETNSASRD
jgi:glycogen debranching enzyme